MMLPKLDTPTYELNLISTGKPVRYRPFLVKEQKLFLMSAETDDTKELITTVRNVLKNCLLDEIDVDSLPSFDLEYLFMNLRARSVEEIVNLKYKCNNNVKNEEGNDKKCGIQKKKITIKINNKKIENTFFKNIQKIGYRYFKIQRRNKRDKNIVKSFQQHYLPKTVTGIVDQETCMISHFLTR